MLADASISRACISKAKPQHAVWPTIRARAHRPVAAWGGGASGGGATYRSGWPAGMIGIRIEGRRDVRGGGGGGGGCRGEVRAASVTTRPGKYRTIA
jgi:hypothetical protein